MSDTPQTNVPDNVVSQNDLDTWYGLQKELVRIRAAEMLLRTKIFKAYFPEPVEGTNTFPLLDGWVMKGKHTINREIDPGALGAYKEMFAKSDVNVAKLVQYKPSLVLSEYRMLTAEQQKLFDNALIVKPGAPAIEVVLPAKARKEVK